MKTKDGSVNLVDLHPKLASLLPRISAWWYANAGYDAICTSACDGKHGTYSRHYIGCAIDLRTWTTESSGRQMPGTTRRNLRHELAQFLGPHFNVIDEGDHFHVGFKPTQPVSWSNLI